MYQCFLTNEVGEDTRSTWLKIKSKTFISPNRMIFHFHLGEAPTVSVSKDLIVFNGTDVQLTCTVNGSPLPNVTWFKYRPHENERLPLDKNLGRFYVDNRTGMLSISNTIRDDSGQYECLAQNILGSNHARTTLLVRRKYSKDWKRID